MSNCRVNQDENEFYTKIDKDEAKMADNEQTEQERIDSLTERLMGGDDNDLLAEVLAEDKFCVEVLGGLCSSSINKTVDEMTLSEIRALAVRGKTLVWAIESQVRKGVSEGHYS